MCGEEVTNVNVQTCITSCKSSSGGSGDRSEGLIFILDEGYIDDDVGKKTIEKENCTEEERKEVAVNK